MDPIVGDEETPTPLTRAEERIYLENKKILRYQAAVKEYRESEKKQDALTKVLKLFPHWNNVAGIILFTLFAAAAIHYSPQIVDWIMINWVGDTVGNRNMFIISIMLNCTLFVIGFFTLVFAGKPMRIWLKAFIKRKPILLMFTKNRTAEMIVPQEVDLDMWTIDDESAIVPDPEAIVPTLHKISMMCAVPELGFGFNPRNILQGRDINIDMTVIRQYADKHEQRMFHQMQSTVDWIKPLMPWFVVLLVMGAIFGPFFWGKIGDMDEGKKWRTEYENCRVDMLDAGVVPPGLVTKYNKTAEEVENDPTKVNPQFAGVSIK
jgi:hypothetical protein